MGNQITLRGLIGILELMADEYGDQKVLSLGAVSGEINGIFAPYTIHLESGKPLYLPSQEVSK